MNTRRRPLIRRSLVSRMARLAAGAAVAVAVAVPAGAAHAACNPNIPGICVKPFATCNLTDVTRPICGG